jgi:hypothetical protein
VEDSQKGELESKSLYTVVQDAVPSSIIAKKNKAKSWEYGYNERYDIIVISKDGTIGEVYLIQGIKVALPSRPPSIHARAKKWEDQYWEVAEYPRELERIQTIFQWEDMPADFKDKWSPYIEDKFDKRELGDWFMNNGIATYITGSHYTYLTWSKIDVGLPDFREANRILYIHWEACCADDRSFGQSYLKIRRSGFSFMASSEATNKGTLAKKRRIGILSKTGADAKKMFTDKVVPINSNYPFFFKPIMDGMDKPKTELSYRVPASKITKNSMNSLNKETLEGLETTIDWKNTADNSYDGEKLLLLVHDECYHPETEIMNSNMDFVKIKDLKVGDSVMVEGGVKKTIVKRTEGVADSYLIRQPYGSDYIVTENHRLVLNLYNKGEVVMTAREFYESSKFKKQHLTRVVSKGIESEDIFDGMPPYMLGLWLGDGRKGALTFIVNQDEEPEILHYLGRMASMWGLKTSIRQRKECKAHVVELTILNGRSELKNIGVLNNKHIPEQYMKSSIGTRLQILAGIIDTDGYSDHKKSNIEIGMSNEALVRQIRTLALSCGISCSPVKRKKSNYNTDVYRLAMSGELSLIPILTKKKSFDGYTPKTRGRRNKVRIEHIGPSEYVGVQVNAEVDEERKLILSDYTISMNSGKWLPPDNILNNWRVTKTCLRLGRKIIGKCMMGSTCNALAKGGANFKKIYNGSDPLKRNANGQTESGLYALFIPMEHNMEGFIDRYGMPVLRTPKKPVMGIDGEPIRIGAIDYWENEVDSKKSDPDDLNEFYRQYPRTESHAFRDESKESIFNLTKIYQQIDYNDNMIKEHHLTRGGFHWENGIKDTKVIWSPDRNGRFLVSWLPSSSMQNKIEMRGGRKFPANEHVGSFGCDSYDISGTVGGGGSNGSLHGLTKMHMDSGPSNEFFLQYIARPQTAEIFFEEVLMAIVFYGMPILVENNKPRLLYHLKNRGYRGYSMNRPDKPISNLSKTELELGGLPNSSEDVKQAHASAIESYIEKYIGLDMDGSFRDPDEMGSMPFTRTLEDWARFDINNRTKFDASISSGLAIMANQRHLYTPQTQQSKITVNFARYSNDGKTSQLKR